MNGAHVSPEVLPGGEVLQYNKMNEYESNQREERGRRQETDQRMIRVKNAKSEILFAEITAGYPICLFTKLHIL